MVRPLHHGVSRVLAHAGGAARSEDGFSLVLAIMLMVVLTITTGAVVTYAMSNQKAAARDTQSLRAFDVAEAGLDSAVNTLATTDPTNSQPVGTTTATQSITLDGATGTWSATKVDANRWVATATVTSPDGKIVRKLQRIIDAQYSSTSTAASPVYGWGFFMADKNADCTVISGGGDTIGNGAQITVPTFIASSLCLSGGGSPLIAEPAGSTSPSVPLYVGGLYRTSGNSSPVGTSTQHIKSATIVGGCQTYFKKVWTNVICSTPGSPTSGTGSGIWADSYGSNPMNLTKPTIDPDYWYANAQPGPMHPCTTQSGIAVPFESAGSTVRDTSAYSTGYATASPKEVRLLYLSGASGSGNDFDCTVKDAQGNVIGRIAWTFGTPGQLTIQGTVFIDGNLDLEGNDKAQYSGNGTLYVDGTVIMQNGARLCGAPLTGTLYCSGTWDPSSGNSLEIVAVNHQNASAGWQMIGDSEYEGTAYVVGRYVSDNSAWTQGPVIADSGQLAGATTFKPITNPPPGAPGAPALESVFSKWRATQWRECPPNGSCPALP